MSHNIFAPARRIAQSGRPTMTSSSADQSSDLNGQFAPPSGMAEECEVYPSAKDPAISLTTEDDGKLLVLQMNGKVHKDDYLKFVPIIEQAIEKQGNVHMIVEMHNFHGWDAGALWEHVSFDLRSSNQVERLAMIGDAKWEQWMGMFCKPFTTATIKYFAQDQASEARAWARTDVDRRDVA